MRNQLGLCNLQKFNYNEVLIVKVNLTNETAEMR